MIRTKHLHKNKKEHKSHNITATPEPESSLKSQEHIKSQERTSKHDVKIRGRLKRRNEPSSAPPESPPRSQERNRPESPMKDKFVLDLSLLTSDSDESTRDKGEIAKNVPESESGKFFITVTLTFYLIGQLAFLTINLHLTVSLTF